MTQALKETKAQRVERLKREKNPLESLEEIRRFAREGHASISPEWLGTYFRWWGVYTQGDGVGAIGGTNGEGRSLPYFMVRIRIPNGILSSEQLRTIASLAQDYARGSQTSRFARTSSFTGWRSRLCRNCWSVCGGQD